MASKLATFLKKHFSKPEMSEDISSDEKATFILMHRELHLGTLELNEGTWSFEYSHIYKQLLNKAEPSTNLEYLVQPLFAFPDINKKYTSPTLWHFFVARIPGLKQPDVQDIMKAKNIERTDLVALLTQFGRKTITNPFELRLEPVV